MSKNLIKNGINIIITTRVYPLLGNHEFFAGSTLVSSLAGSLGMDSSLFSKSFSECSIF